MVFLYGLQHVLAQAKAGMKKRLIVLVRGVEALNQSQQCCPIKICEFCFDIGPRGLRFRLTFGHTPPRFYPCGPNTGNQAPAALVGMLQTAHGKMNPHSMNAAIPERRPATEEISGLIERVTFHNDESGFCVLRVKARGQREETTVVGSLPSVTAGEWLSAEGWWVRDKEHGLQFKATIMKTVPPTTAEGIERYLGSGLVKGIGPILAKKLVGRFGAEVLAVIENRAAELQTVDGIGPKRRERIAHAWQEAKQVREIMLFLHSHGVSTSRAVRIFKTYGEQAIEKVRSNPVHAGERHLRDRLRDRRPDRPEGRDSARLAQSGKGGHRPCSAGSDFGRTLCAAARRNSSSRR